MKTMKTMKTFSRETDTGVCNKYMFIYEYVFYDKC